MLPNNQLEPGQFRMVATAELIESLRPGQARALRARIDGTVLEGHHRLVVLAERGVDIDALPREVIPQESESQGALQAKVFWIAGPWQGRPGILPRPRGGDWLGDEMTAWRESGIDVVVSLLEPEEEAQLVLEGEAAAAAAS